MRVWLSCPKCDADRVFFRHDDDREVFECETCGEYQYYPTDYPHKRYFGTHAELRSYVRSVFKKHGLVR